jgi:hypothetical protein
MKVINVLALSACALAVAACTTPPSPTSSTPTVPNTLVVAKAMAAPTLDGNPNEPAWAAAQPLRFTAEDGRNFKDGATDVTLKSVVVGDTIYFLLQYTDPTNSMRRQPFQKQPDGSWKKLADPSDKGGDDNMYYEDKWSLIWDTSTNPVKGFAEKGCAVMCHVGEGKPFGNKYTAGEGQIADMWHMKGARNGVLGFVDDQFVDWTRYEPGKTPNAGRKGDPGGPDYRVFSLKDGKPDFMNKDGRAANAGGTYAVKEGDQVPFVDNFKPGDEVSSYIVFPLKGDRGDLRVGYRWANGVWTYEVARKLVTGSQYDVQFDNMDKVYNFGFAAFDNAQVRHALNYDVLQLRFAQ